MSTESERVALFVDAVKDDPRVLGVALLATGPRTVPRLLVVTTWDGLATLPAELPRLAGALLAAGPRIERVGDGRWIGIDADGCRAEIELRRAGDLVATYDGIEATPLHDPQKLVAQWVACCRREPDERVERELADQPLDHILSADLSLRWESDQVRREGTLRDDWLLEGVRERLRADDPVEAALASRIDAALVGEPLGGAGSRPRADDDPPTAFESFLRVADAEGFKGDRVLFNEATKRLHDLAKRAPVFDQGFVVPTFDAVEAGFALGEAVGGCQPPLIPGVYVGVGVTPKDALEFWAAPFVRDPTCSVACVDDTGDRDVVLRAAGRDPMIATLTSVVDAAFDRLPALIDRARDATKESVDPSAVLATLHLPKTFVERAKRRGADALMCSRLTVALAVARAGHDCAPLVARKFGLAAGRVIAARS